MDDFLAQVKVMVSYTGFGDDDYATFMTACEALYGAFKRKDLTLFAECFAVVLSLKKECHHRYK
jgi:XXXCH domain-containing protein